MAKGENIFKRKDGRWEARCVKGSKVFLRFDKKCFCSFWPAFSGRPPGRLVFYLLPPQAERRSCENFYILKWRRGSRRISAARRIR